MRRRCHAAIPLLEDYISTPLLPCCLLSIFIIGHFHYAISAFSRRCCPLFFQMFADIFVIFELIIIISVFVLSSFRLLSPLCFSLFFRFDAMPAFITLSEAAYLLLLLRCFRQRDIAAMLPSAIRFCRHYTQRAAFYAFSLIFRFSPFSR
jgi:hypothetical protein